jgi:transcriptional regulator with XRE-family HTH domain
MANTFGELIAEARKARGISQKDLAARIKREDGKAISPQYLNDIERDRRNPPSEHLILQLATELGLSKDYLVLAAGSLPRELEERMRGADPKAVEKAFQAFRRQIKK